MGSPSGNAVKFSLPFTVTGGTGTYGGQRAAARSNSKRRSTRSSRARPPERSRFRA
jgi:hypothetical protein